MKRTCLILLTTFVALSSFATDAKFVIYCREVGEAASAANVIDMWMSGTQSSIHLSINPLSLAGRLDSEADGSAPVVLSEDKTTATCTLPEDKAIVTFPAGAVTPEAITNEASFTASVVISGEAVPHTLDCMAQ